MNNTGINNNAPLFITPPPERTLDGLTEPQIQFATEVMNEVDEANKRRDMEAIVDSVNSLSQRASGMSSDDLEIGVDPLTNRTVVNLKQSVREDIIAQATSGDGLPDTTGKEDGMVLQLTGSVADWGWIRLN